MLQLRSQKTEDNYPVFLKMKNWNSFFKRSDCKFLDAQLFAQWNNVVRTIVHIVKYLQNRLVEQVQRPPIDFCPVTHPQPS